MTELTTAHILSPDTQAVLLLCGHFGRDAAVAPLAPGEYDRLAQWLLRQELRPAALLDPSTQARAGQALDLPVDPTRLEALLARGAALALAVESWSNKGLWVISRSDEAYPRRLRGRRGAPPLLYGAGDPALLNGGGLAMVGARDADAAALAYTTQVAQACAAQDLAVVSGGARGVDITAMEAALEAGGRVVGVLADNLARATVAGHYRTGLAERRLVLISPYNPHSGFDVGNAMGRNRYIYALADWALVVSAMREKGGTWAGATEALRAGTPPVFVRMEVGASPGNAALLDLGAHSFPLPPWPDLRTALAAVPASPSPEGVQTAMLLNEPAPAYPPPVPPPAAQTAFDAVLPLLLAYLAQPLDVKTLAARLEARPAQVQDWLERALETRQVVKVGKPVCYVVAPGP